MNLPFAPSCENNQAPICEVLQHALAQSRHVLEIGSGTGQHSVYMAPRLPHLLWQTSELPALHPGIRQWHQAHPASNCLGPVAMDLATSSWPQTEHGAFDAVFTSNTLHIVAWPLVQRLFALVGENLPPAGVFVAYGPFNYDGSFTSESNRQFDAWLKSRDPVSGIRDRQDLERLAVQHGLRLESDHAMPANNRTLVFRKE